MNYLQLVQELWRESGSGGTMPVTVTGQTGESGRLVEWIRSADIYLQSLYTDWNFLWGQEFFSTTPSLAFHTPAVPIGDFDRHAWFINSEPLRCVEYIEVKDYPRPTDPGRPYQAVIMPDRRIRLDPSPDKVYTVRFDYWAPATAMAPDGNSQSIVPPEYHEAIIGKALMMYAEYENAPEVMEKGTRKLSDWLTVLQARQLPGGRFMHKVAEGNDMVITVE